MATLDDIKKVLEKILASNASSSTGKSAGKTHSAITDEERLKAAVERQNLAREEVKNYEELNKKKILGVENAENARILAEANLELEKAQLALLNERIKGQSKLSTEEKKHWKLEKNNLEKGIKQREAKKKSDTRKAKDRKKALSDGKVFASQATNMAKKTASLGMNQSAIGQAIAKQAGSMVNMVGSMGSLVSSGFSFASSLAAAGVALGPIAIIIGAIVLALLPLAIGGAILGGMIAITSYMVSLAVEARDAAAAFTMLTGASMEFGKDAVQLKADLAGINASYDEISKSMAGLYKGTTIFSQANSDTRKELAGMAVVMERWGVSTATYSKGVEAMVTSMGIADSAAADEMWRLKKHAEIIGQAPEQYVSLFSEMGDSLSLFDDAIGTFKELARVQKLTGMEMRTILDLTRKFDTFEGAATMAGNLNAALGGNFVNAMDMMMETDPVARFEMIRDAIKGTGLEFDTMGYHQKQFYMKQLGFSKVSDLAKLMRGGDLKGLAGDYSKTADELEAAEKETKRFQSTMNVLKGMLNQLQPVFVKLIDPIQKFVDSLTGKDGPSDQMIGLRDSIDSLVTEALIPFINDLPKLIASFQTWTENNSELIDDFIELIPVAIEVTMAITKFLALFTGEAAYSASGWFKLFSGDVRAAGKDFEKSLDITNKNSGALRTGLNWISKTFLTATFGPILGQFDAITRGVVRLAAAFTEEHSLSFNQSLEHQNKMFAALPNSIDGATKAMGSMTSPLAKNTKSMNLFGDATSSAFGGAVSSIGELKDAFVSDMATMEASSETPLMMRATAAVAKHVVESTSSGVRTAGAALNRATAGISQTPTTSPGAAAQQSPMVKQPIEVVLRTEEGVLAKQIINVIGREIQAVVS